MVAAVLGGGAVAGTFAPVDFWPLALLGVAVLTLVCRGRSAQAGLGYGLLFGLGTFVPVLVWLRVIGVDAWLALALLEAVLFAPLGLATALVTRLRAWPVWVAALWVAQEAWRDRIPFGGFPWARLAFGQSGSPLLSYAAIGGAPLVTFTVALAGALLAAAAIGGFRLRGRPARGGGVGLLRPRRRPGPGRPRGGFLARGASGCRGWPPRPAADTGA